MTELETKRNALMNKVSEKTYHCKVTIISGSQALVETDDWTKTINLSSPTFQFFYKNFFMYFYNGFRIYVCGDITINGTFYAYGDTLPTFTWTTGTVIEIETKGETKLPSNQIVFGGEFLTTPYTFAVVDSESVNILTTTDEYNKAINVKYINNWILKANQPVKFNNNTYNTGATIVTIRGNQLYIADIAIL